MILGSSLPSLREILPYLYLAALKEPEVPVLLAPEITKRPPSMFELDEVSVSSFLAQSKQRLQRAIYSFDKKTLKKLAEINAKRAKEGKPPIDLAEVTRRVEAVANTPGLEQKEKERRIDAIRKEFGLEKDEMKELVTERLETIHEKEKQRVEKYAETTKKRLEEEVKSAEQAYGANSPQAVEAKRRLEAVGAILQNRIDELEAKRSLYNAMYKAGGCIKKMFKGIGGFFKGVVQTIGNTLKSVINPANWFKPAFWRDIVAPIALAAIPGAGPVLATAYKWGLAAYQGIKGFVKLVQGKWREALGAFGGVLAKVKALAPAVQKFIDKAKEVVGRGLERALYWHPLNLLREAKPIREAVETVLPAAKPVFKIADKVAAGSYWFLEKAFGPLPKEDPRKIDL